MAGAKPKRRRKVPRNFAQELSEYLEKVLGEDETSLSGLDPNRLSRVVGRLGNKRFIVQADEHSPPHFHVRSPDFDVAYSIADCQLVWGTAPHGEERVIKNWYRTNKPVAVKEWNAMRPSDCPVGRVLDKQV